MSGGPSVRSSPARPAARLLNLKAATLNAKIKRHGIRPDAFKTADDTFFT